MDAFFFQGKFDISVLGMPMCTMFDPAIISQNKIQTDNGGYALYRVIETEHCGKYIDTYQTFHSKTYSIMKDL